ncbi:MAG: hypothetical protein IPG50_33460 [Myxococcales bacterium]|nr:hypothetical protein [Myxococcales bacterium]
MKAPIAPLTVSAAARVLEAGLAGDAAPRERPAPWLMWLIVTLQRQRVRQAWHHETVRQLRLDLSASEDDEYEDTGDVPALPGWTYEFHGSGCCLTAPDGEILDVDANDPDGAVIDPWFFATRAQSLSKREGPEKRVFEFVATRELLVWSLADLKASGILEPPKGHLFRLAAPIEALADRVAREDFGNEQVRARWGVALSDGDDTCAAAHREWLATLARRREGGVITALEALLPADDARLLWLAILDGPVDPTCGLALARLRRYPSSAVDGAVRAFLDRVDPNKHLPYPAHEALAYLFERDIDRPHILARLATFAAVEHVTGFGGNPFIGSYAVLALTHAPSLAMGLVRRALRSPVPLAVGEVAALLAAIDQPWCIREFEAAIKDATPAGAITLTEALRSSHSELARRRGVELDVAPEHDPTSLGFTFEEVLHNSIGDLFAGPLEKARPLADTLRERFPPGWDGT